MSTVNLDGETNLKERRAQDLCSGFCQLVVAGSGEVKSVEQIHQLGKQIARQIVEQGLIINLEDPKPGPMISGTVQLNSPTAAVSAVLAKCKTGDVGYLSADNFLLRGCVLRNTPWIVGAVAYAGSCAKVNLNVPASTPKVSNLQRFLNRVVISLVCILFVVCLYTALITAFAIENDYSPIENFCIYWIILYQVVPISLYVLFEAAKLCLAVQVNIDKSMIDERNNTPALARTADLMEEMGQVDFVFSDKTGTLTENEMVFAKAHTANVELGDFRGDGPTVEAVKSRLSEMSKDPTSSDIWWYFFCVAVCHDASVDMVDNGSPSYTGNSSEEVAFLEAAALVGIMLVSRKRMAGSSGWELHIQTPQGEQVVTTVCDIPFSSDRKRMSVICRYKSQAYIMTKGADSVMNPLCNHFNDVVLENLQIYSSQGLRTLVMGRKAIDNAFLDPWLVRMENARHALDDREERMAAVAAEIENNLTFTGILSLEDRLQPGVSESISTLKSAGIRFWVLTGDKTETAVEIVRACQLFTPETKLAYAVSASSSERASELLASAKQTLMGSKDGGLVLDGTLVSYALMLPADRHSIYELACMSRSCVCCRLSPLQKRKLIELVREENHKAITLAIGDGANDVPMIHGAHVGVGIRGREGNQAIQACDVALSRFRFIVPLLLCHGRRAYRRTSVFVCYYFYKHILLAVCDIIWAHQSNFGGNIAVPEWLSSAYAVILTSVPVLVIVVFDTDVSDKVSISSPTLYEDGLQRRFFNHFVVGMWLVRAVWHGCVAWLVPSLIFGYSSDTDDWFWEGSTISFSLALFFSNFQLWLVSMNKFSWQCLGMLIASYAMYIVILCILCYTALGESLQPGMPDVLTYIMRDLDSVAVLFLTPLILAIDVTCHIARKFLFTTQLDKARTSWAFHI